MSNPQDTRPPGRGEGHEPSAPGGSTSFFFREAARRIWRSKRTSSTAVLMTTIAVTVLGIFLLVSENLQRAVESWEGRTSLTVYLATDAGDDEIAAIRSALENDALLGEARFVSKQEAAERFRTHFASLGPLVDELDESPFPPSFDVRVTPRQISDPRFAEAVREVAGMAGVDQVQFDWMWVDRLRGLIRGLRLVGLIAGGILAIAAAFTIANVMRLTIALYREEIDIMRLVGASEWMVRGPLLVQGVMQGLVGSVLALAALFGLFALARSMTEGSVTIIDATLLSSFLPLDKIVWLLLGGAAAGLIGGWMSIGEVDEDAPVRG